METQDTQQVYRIISIGYKQLTYKAFQKPFSTQNLTFEISSKTVIKKLMDLPAALLKLQVNSC